MESLIDKSKGDVILDYRVGDSALIQQLQEAVQKATGGKVKAEYAFDAISDHGSFQNLSQVLDLKIGHIVLISPGRDYSAIPEGITKKAVYVGWSHEAQDNDPWQQKTGTQVGNQEFAHAFFRFFGRGLQKGWLKGHPFEVVEGGLGGVEGALKALKEGKASAVKYVFRIGETPGIA